MKALLALALTLLFAASVSAQPRLTWEYKAAGTVSTDLAVDGGVLFFGSSSPSPENPNRTVGRVYGLNASTGRLVVNHTSPAGVYSTPEFHGGLVVYGCDNGVVYAVDRSTGQGVWSFVSDGMVRSSPVVHNGVVYVGSDDGRLYALKAGSGKLLWSYRAGAPVVSEPLFDRWRIYFPAGNRKAYSLTNVSGSLIWSRDFRGEAKSRPAVYRDFIIYATSDRRVTALDKYTGETVWNRTFNGTLYGSPAVYGDLACVSAGDRTVSCLSAKTGDTAWTAVLNDSPQSAPRIASGTLYAAAGSTVYAYGAADGSPLYRLNVSGLVRKTPQTADRTLYVAAGSYVKAYGGSADIRVASIEVSPRVPAAGEAATVEATVTNAGDSVAADVEVRAYVDRANASSGRMTLHPGENMTFRFNVTGGYGRHLVEVNADEAGRIVDVNRSDNRAGMVYSTAAEWTIPGGGLNRTGHQSRTERFTANDTQVTWSCRPERENATLEFPRGLLEGYSTAMRSGARGIEVWLSCEYYPRRGYPAGRLNSTWACRSRNATGITDLELDAYRDYVFGNGSCAGKQAVSKSFMMLFECTGTGTGDIPPENAWMTLDCSRHEPGNATCGYATGWSCYERYGSNHSLKALAEAKGYPYMGAALGRGVNASSYRSLWNASSGGKATSPVILDLDGSGDGMLETVYGSWDGRVYAVSSDGRPLWTAGLGGRVETVSAADLDRDGRREILAGTSDGRLVLIGRDGTVEWTYNAGGGVAHSPLALDVDNTPEYEAVFGSGDKSITAVSHDGLKVWSYNMTGKPSTDPAAADLDGDGRDEVIVGSDDNILYALRTPPYKVWMYQGNGDISGAAATQPNRRKPVEILATSWDGRLYGLAYGTMGSEDSKRVCSNGVCTREGGEKTMLRQRWNYTAAGPVQAAPAVADIDGDGSMEAVFGSDDRSLYAVNMSGYRLFRYTTSGPVRSAPALADLDMDGASEIIFGSDDGRAYIINGRGETLWTADLNSTIRTRPAVADVDADGRLEFAIAADDGTVRMHKAE